MAMVLVKQRRPKRRRTGVSMVHAGPQRALPAVPRNLRGYARIGGFYGRYSGRGAELKFHNLDVDDAVIATGGTIAEDSLLTIAEGNGESDRVGRKVTVKRIQMNYDFLLPQTAVAAQTSDAVRVILYWDKQTNGAAATVLGILEVADWQSFRNLANSGRFQVLLDKTVSLNCGAGSGRGTTDTLSYAEVEKHFSWSKACNIPIEYDNSATTGVITSIRSNNLGILTISKGGLAAFGSRIRIRYSDQ